MKIDESSKYPAALEPILPRVLLTTPLPLPPAAAAPLPWPLPPPARRGERRAPPGVFNLSKSRGLKIARSSSMVNICSGGGAAPNAALGVVPRGVHPRGVRCFLLGDSVVAPANQENHNMDGRLQKGPCSCAPVSAMTALNNRFPSSASCFFPRSLLLPPVCSALGSIGAKSTCLLVDPVAVPMAVPLMMTLPSASRGVRHERGHFQSPASEKKFGVGGVSAASASSVISTSSSLPASLPRLSGSGVGSDIPRALDALVLISRPKPDENSDFGLPNRDRCLLAALAAARALFALEITERNDRRNWCVHLQAS